MAAYHTNLVDCTTVELLLLPRCTSCLLFMHGDTHKSEGGSTRAPSFERSTCEPPHLFNAAPFVCHVVVHPPLLLNMPAPAGLDISNLSELALSPDGERLIVTNLASDDQENLAALSDLNGSVAAAGRGAPPAGTTAGLGGQASSKSTSKSSSSPSSSRNAPARPLLGGQRSAGQAAVSSCQSSPSSTRLPLVRRKHVALLLRSHGLGGGGGDSNSCGVDTPTAAAVYSEKVNWC